MSQLEKIRLALEAKVGESITRGNVAQWQQVADAWKVARRDRETRSRSRNAHNSSQSEALRFWAFEQSLWDHSAWWQARRD